MNLYLAIVLSLGLFCLFAQKSFVTPRGGAYERARNLFNYDMSRGLYQGRAEIDWSNKGLALTHLSSPLGQAAVFSASEIRRIQMIKLIGGLSCVIGGGLIGANYGTIYAFLGVAAGLYCSFLAWLLFLRHRRAEFRRQVYYSLPLFLEELILLVESGFGVLPSIQHIVASHEASKEKGDLLVIFKIVYELSAHGIPFGQALQETAEAVTLSPLRHVLLHLDITSSVGGELVPALRSISNHAHTEWRLSVEERVKRLENFVVFPVFLAVIGLMFTVAAVPIVPVLEFADRVEQREEALSTSTKVGRSITGATEF